MPRNRKRVGLILAVLAVLGVALLLSRPEEGYRHDPDVPFTYHGPGTGF